MVAPGLYVLAGPTAAGKTGVAHQLAAELNARILSVDALHAYRGMNIGTAKPTPEELRAFEYAGVDFLDPWEINTAGAFRSQALAALRSEPGRIWIAAGGSGLYFHALLCGLPEDSCASHPEHRQHVQQVFDRDGLPGLQEWLRAAAPDRWAALADPRNPRRVMRALELALSGAAAPASAPRAIPDMVALDRDAAELRERIRERAGKMFREGLVEETRALMAVRPEWSVTARRAIGYAEAAAVALGELEIHEAVTRTAARTHAYARRQRTWLRTQCRTEWIPSGGGRTMAEIARDVREAWSRHGPFHFAS
ncbi:MAG: tRNA (adenosine(37)-N6)-dimethylallyltransferase MiaA [Kiritimatiellae bacterium]|nr:tRNA (adenosine(37)-N6)-dimethylallyltransferase MiaA [Kiritimatiellia bacterium]